MVESGGRWLDHRHVGELKPARVSGQWHVESEGAWGTERAPVAHRQGHRGM